MAIAQPAHHDGHADEDRRLSRFSTTGAPVSERIGLWEQYNEEELFRLRCTTLSEQSLLATQTNLDLDQLRLTYIQGNDHVIERTRSTISSHPVDAVMLCLLLRGNAFLYSRTGCETLGHGEAVVYDADRPFVYGFSTNMQMLIIEVPKAVIHIRPADEDRYGPRVLRFSGGAETHAQLAARSSLARVERRTPVGPGFEESVLDTFHLLTGAQEKAHSHVYVDLAHAFIQSRLAEDLSVERVASKVGISPRQLTRLFKDSGTTPGRHITEQRLERAAELLRNEQGLSVRQIASRVGIRQPERFSRAFKSRFSMTPRDYRAAVQSGSIPPQS